MEAKHIKPLAIGRRVKALDVLKMCGGYYSSLKDSDGERLSPLVGYTSRDEHGRQYVGDTYFNFSKIERQGLVMKEVSASLYNLLCHHGNSMELPDNLSGFCGVPEGGKAIATVLAGFSDKQYIFPEKKIIIPATSRSREVSELIFSRHKPGKGERWWITEDICHTFSTTETLIWMIESFGASVAGIVCFLNASTTVSEEYRMAGRPFVPVISLVRYPVPVYRQDDPTVAGDIKRGNVIWKPKNEWDQLTRLTGHGHL